IAGHFTGDAREWSRSRIRNEIHDITYELTGNELIALILESQQIRKFWPRYNRAQKSRTEEWGIFQYEDRNGLLRFSVNVVTRGARQHIRFSNKGDTWNFLWQKLREYNLCPKLCGMQVARGLCFEYQTGECNGACMGLESHTPYNRRVQKALASFHDKGSSVAIVGKGRDAHEQSLVLVEEGTYFGFGFVGRDVAISDIASARTCVNRGTETPTVQNLINSYLMNPRGAEVITLS